MKLIVLSLLLVSSIFSGAQQIEVSAHRQPFTRYATVGYVSTPDKAKFVAKNPDSNVGGLQTFLVSKETMSQLGSGNKPTPDEAKLNAEKPDSGVGGDQTLDDAKKAGSLLGKRKKLISWFGIVRVPPAKEEDTFLIEHKHFDGLNDCHMQLASLFGVGDFKFAAKDTKGAMKPLSLVRVIGMVADESNGIPTVKTEYISVWQLGDFAFMDYGADATNERWKKLRQKVPLIYTPTPDAAYYESLLGKLPDGCSVSEPSASGGGKPPKPIIGSTK